jgi:hypothetical protein
MRKTGNIYLVLRTMAVIEAALQSPVAEFISTGCGRVLVLIVIRYSTIA